MTSSASDMSSTGGMKDDAPMPSTSCGPASPPFKIDPCGSTTTHQHFGLRSFRYFATPLNVPPVPAPATHPSTRPSICSQISAPVVSKCDSALYGFANCCGTYEFAIVFDN